MDYHDTYRKKTPRSARIFAESARLHVRGVSHNIRYFDPYPFVVKSSTGKSLVDADSNRYTDYWMGHWAMVLGHTDAAVKKALKEQMEHGWMYGTVNQQTVALSGMISKAVPVAEKIRYVTSGTEATMYATRLARSATGRKIIAKIDGGWHGYASDLLKTVNWPFQKSESTGLVGERQIVSIPYNDLEKSLAILQRHAGNLAGLIVEPLLGGGGCIPAERDYLAGLQEFCKSNDSLFMLDEIVTGFRFVFGCLYRTMNLDPDIVTLGKITGGGMPIGIMCGKSEIMRHATDSNGKKAGRSYVGGGTFSANPASMAAGLATLNRLKSGAIHRRINRLGNIARRELSRLLDGSAILTGKGSLFMTHFTNRLSEITSPAQAARCNGMMLRQYHLKLMAHDGIFFLPGKLGAVSGAHTRQDIKDLIRATEYIVE